MAKKTKSNRNTTAIAELPLFATPQLSEPNWNSPDWTAIAQVFFGDLFPEKPEERCDRIGLFEVCPSFSWVLEWWIMRCSSTRHQLFFASALMLCRIHRQLAWPLALGIDRWHILIHRWHPDLQEWHCYQIPGQWSRQEAAYYIQGIKGSFKWWLSSDRDDRGRPIEDDSIFEYLKACCRQQQHGILLSMNDELY